MSVQRSSSGGRTVAVAPSHAMKPQRPRWVRCGAGGRCYHQSRKVTTAAGTVP